MTEELLKYTKSLSPLSLKAIDAKIISDGKNIYMVKKDENGQEYRALIEKDKNTQFDPVVVEAFLKAYRIGEL